MKRRLLSLPGGGMRGLPQCGILAEIERRAGKPISEIFHLIGCTSVGAIVGASACAGNSMADTLGFFTQDGPKIFAPRFLGEIGEDADLLLNGHRYHADVLESCLKERIGTGSLYSAKTNLLITAFDLATYSPFFFKSYDPATTLYAMWQAARASSAAETYFPQFALGNKLFWDGGTAANNPAMCVYADAVRLWGDEEDYEMLTIGCSTPKRVYPLETIRTAGAVKTAFEATNALLVANAEVPAYQIKQILGDNSYVIQPTGITTALDDASPAAIASLQAILAQTITSNEEIIEHFSNP